MQILSSDHQQVGQNLKLQDFDLDYILVNINRSSVRINIIHIFIKLKIPFIIFSTFTKPYPEPGDSGKYD